MKIYFDDPMVDAPAYVDDLAQQPASPPTRSPARRTKREKDDINKVWNAVFDHMIDNATKNFPDDALISYPRRRLRNWQKFAMCYVPIMAGGALILWDYAGPATALVGLAIWLTTMLIILTLAGRAGRL